MDDIWIYYGYLPSGKLSHKTMERSTIFNGAIMMVNVSIYGFV